jgi:ferritin-like metal-binding protein YciE
MATDIKRELITCLTEIHAIEQQGLELLTGAVDLTGDEQIAEIYRTHCLQTDGHARSIAERLHAHGSSPINDTAAGLEFLGLRVAPDGGGSPARLAMTTYALESLEIAAYHLLRGIAERAGDHDTTALVDSILEEEEAAAEIMASTFDRVLEVSLGESPRSPVSRPRADPINRRRRSQG